MKPNPMNFCRWLPLNKAALIRHLLIECNLSKEKLVTALAICYTIFFEEPPEEDDLPSVPSIDLAMQQLSDIDRQRIGQKNCDHLIASGKYARMYSCADDTKFLAQCMHSHFISHFNIDIGSPEFTLLFLKGTPGKDADVNAAQDLKNLL